MAAAAASASAAPAAAATAASAASKLPPPLKPEMDEVSDNKKAKVNEFYDKVWVPSSTSHKNWPTTFKEMDEDNARIWCYKLMVARKFDIAAAKEMLETIIAFRVENKTEDRPYFPSGIEMRGYDLEALCKFFKQPGGKPREQNEFIDKIKANMQCCYTPCFHKTTKWGHPVVIESYGRAHPVLLPVKAKQLAPIGKPFSDIAATFHIHSNETAVRLAHFQDETWAKPRGTRVLGIVSVVDVEGLSMAHLGSDMLSCIQTMFTMDAKAYPEFLHKVLVINCGALIRLAYSLVSPFLDKRVQEKISFFAPGEATKAGLLEWIHAEDLPAHLGGKCNCPGRCVPFPSEETVAKELEAVKKGGQVGDGLAELGVPIAAGAAIERVLEVKAGEEATWDWQSDSGLTVEFKVVHVSANGGKETEVVKPDKIIDHCGSYTATEAGKVKLIFSNAFSWMRSKYVTLRTFVVPKANLAVEGGVETLEHWHPAHHAAAAAASE